MSRLRAMTTPAVVGLLLFATTAGWALVSSASAGVAAGPFVGSVLLTGVALGASWIVSTRWPIPVLVTLVAVAVLLLAVEPANVPTGGVTRGPLGYANATASFYGVAIIATLLLAIRVRSSMARIAVALMTVLFGSVVLSARSWAMAILVPALVVLTVATTRLRGARAAVVVCGVAFAGMLLVTLFMGAARVGTGDGLVGRTIRATLSADRILLWHDAIEIMAEEPFLGVGPGRFAGSSEVARRDEDLRWAHHEFLQAGAEIGVLGSVLVVALFVWGFATLWITGDGLGTAIAAAGLAIVGVHATIDYVLHFPAVPLAVAVVVGVEVGSSFTREPADGRLAEAVA